MTLYPIHLCCKKCGNSNILCHRLYLRKNEHNVSGHEKKHQKRHIEAYIIQKAIPIISISLLFDLCHIEIRPQEFYLGIFILSRPIWCNNTMKIATLL